MSEKKPDWQPIETPKANRKADAARAALKGTLGAIPVAGSAVAEAADFILPNPTANNRTDWECDVTEGVNMLHGRIDELDDRTGVQKVSLTGATAYAAKFITEQCPNGLASEEVTLAEICAACPEFTKKEVLDALGELESYGLVESSSFIGSSDEYCMTEYGYSVLDPPIMGWDPEEDARTLAAFVVTERDGVASRDLVAKVDWPRRRFNPALRVLVSFVACVSNELQPHYVTSSFYPTNAELAQLRRFASNR